MPAPYKIPDDLPELEKNNVWYTPGGSDTVLIFLHGIFSNSGRCWLRKQPFIYWPELVRQDARFGGADIFLGGFHTEPGSGDYDLPQCVLEVRDHLENIPDSLGEPVMKRKNLIFIGHSTGGIVARSLLVSRESDFREKNVGLVLIASPSAGSVYATRFAWLAKAYRNQLGAMLQEKSTILEQLDALFAEMVARRDEHIPSLIGAEACEHHMVYRDTLFGRLSQGLPFLGTRIVDPQSAGRYFGMVRMLPKTDHFSCVKPDSVDHDAHLFLLSFWQRYRRQITGSRPPGTPQGPSWPIFRRPNAAEPIVDRMAELAAVKWNLVQSRRCALVGPARIGKTAIALELVHDARFLQEFPDGVLWGELSPTTDSSALLGSWAEALGLARDTVTALRRPEDRASAVENAVGGRKMLLVLDNASQAEDLKLFQLIGPNCAHFLTTRLPELAAELAPGASVRIDGLSEDAALALLERLAPALAPHRVLTRPFVRSVGGMPEDLSLTGRMVGSQSGNVGKILELLRRFGQEAA